MINDLNLSESQQAAMKELQKRMSAVCERKLDDFTYYRFLKARDFDVKQAESMLRNNLQWRKDNKVDIIAEYKPPELLKNYCVNYIIGNEKQGSPVLYFPITKLDFKGMVSAVKMADVMKVFIQLTDNAERLVEEQSKKLNIHLPGCVLIIDHENFSFSLATNKAYINFCIWYCKMVQDNFPERMKAIYVINSSSYFVLIYTIIKRFLSTATLKKIEIFGREGWKEELLKLIDAHELPVVLGGKKTDPDGNPLCQTIMMQGGKVDERHYRPKSRKALANSDGVQQLNLARASFTEMPVEIEEPGSFIEWEFEIKARDIGFGVFYKETSGKGMRLKLNWATRKRTSFVTELVSLERMNTDDFAETGIYQCEKPGTYILLFDNSYSWVRSKEIYYKITVVSSQKHDENVENYGK